MITGMHTVVYIRNAEADRAFFRDVLGVPFADAGGGWLIFAAPPSELAIHPAKANGKCEPSLMWEDGEKKGPRLGAEGINCSPISAQGWGRLTTIRLPSGGELGLYEPRHAIAHGTAG